MKLTERKLQFMKLDVHKKEVSAPCRTKARKTVIVSFLLFLTVFVEAQVRFGIYLQTTNSEDPFGTTYFSQLILDEDGTFRYEHRTTSCWLWFDVTGQWRVEQNLLILIDRTLCEKSASKGSERSIERKTTFIIEGKNLVFKNQHFEVPGYYPLKDIGYCDFKLKELTSK